MQLGKREIIKLIQNGHENSSNIITPNNNSIPNRNLHTRLVSYDHNLNQDKSFNTFQPIQNKKSICMGEYFSFKNEGNSSKLDSLANEDNETISKPNKITNSTNNGSKSISNSIINKTVNDVEAEININSLESSNNKIINSLIQKLKDYKSQFNEVRNENSKLQEMLNKNTSKSKDKIKKMDKIVNKSIDFTPKKVENSVKELASKIQVKKDPVNRITVSNVKLESNHKSNIQNNSNFIKSRLFDYDIMNKSVSKPKTYSRNKDLSNNQSHQNFKEMKNLGNMQFKTLESKTTYTEKVRKSIDITSTKDINDSVKNSRNLNNNQLKLYKLTSFNSENQINSKEVKNKKSFTVMKDSKSNSFKNTKSLSKTKDKEKEKDKGQCNIINRLNIENSNLNVYKSISLSNNQVLYSKAFVQHSNRIHKSLNFDKVQDIKLPLTKKHNQVTVPTSKVVSSKFKSNSNIKFEENFNQDEFELQSTIVNKDALKSILVKKMNIPQLVNFTVVDNVSHSAMASKSNSSNIFSQKAKGTSEVEVYTKKLCSKRNLK